MEIKVEGFSVENSDYYQLTLDLRSQVFVEDLGFDKRLEFDGKDDKAMHYILFYDMVPAACARWTENGDEITIDRFCIEKSFRKRGLAYVLLKFILSELIPSKKQINLLSTEDSLIFFTQAGFKNTGNTCVIGKSNFLILNYSNV